MCLGRVAHCVLRIVRCGLTRMHTARLFWREQRIAYCVLSELWGSLQDKIARRKVLEGTTYHVLCIAYCVCVWQMRAWKCTAHCVLCVRIAYSSFGVSFVLRIVYPYCACEFWAGFGVCSVLRIARPYCVFELWGA